MELLPKSLQLALPAAVARYLPLLLCVEFDQHLEDGVVRGLVPVVVTIVGTLLALDLVILRSREQKIAEQIAGGIAGLVLGSVVFHVTVVLFGAPVVEYVEHSLWLGRGGHVIVVMLQTVAADVAAGCAAVELRDDAAGVALGVCAVEVAGPTAGAEVSWLGLGCYLS
ncbi:unnamed protein product [Phytophthora fragariaefolia]|uniref:Unnamed protein product n=1 Tax=Phytophthora fragariaefolia TaxID=1490495 RepID=A0A9W6X6P5_9STRA|nr:unnamed protein product [Phytophthora fragariaefolia]